MKIYICSGCGWLRVVSRRKEVECFRCGQEMQQSRLTYEKALSFPRGRRNILILSACGAKDETPALADAAAAAPEGIVDIQFYRQSQ